MNKREGLIIMTDKSPNFQYIPELAEYMLKFLYRDKILKSDTESYNYGFHDAPDRVHDAFLDLNGTMQERYDILLQLSEVSKDLDGLEDYIEELEAPVYNGELLDWLGAEYTDDRLEMVNTAISDGAETIQEAIAEAWIECRSSELRAAATALEGYLSNE
jgi:hypothetical protein